MAEIVDPGSSTAPGSVATLAGSEVDGHRQDPVGICISGGGIRAASFGLGALQALQEEQRLLYGDERAEYLAAVSGGSYIAGAVTMISSRYAQSASGRRHADSDPPIPPDEFDGPHYPFAPGTPEVEHLRRRSRYLLGGGAVEAVLQFLVRLGLNIGFLAATVVLVARPAGWLYGWGLPQLATADALSPEEFDLGPVTWLTVVGVAGVVLGLVVVLATTFFRQTLNAQHDVRGRKVGFGTVGTAFLVAGAALLVAGFVLPAWLAWIADRWVTTSETMDVVVEGEPTVHLTLWSAIAAIAAAVASLKSVVPEDAGKSLFSRRLGPLLARLLRSVAALVALVAVPLVVIMFATTMMIGGALNVWWVESDVWLGELVLFGASVVLLIAVALLRDPMVWSLHPFYKKRLMSCYGIKRVRGDDGRSRGAAERPSKPEYLLSQSTSPELPTLLVCAAANVSGFGNAPAGHNVLPFVLSPSEIGFTNKTGKRFETKELEAAVSGTPDRRNITLPAAVAITGAAVSPSMGKMTIAPVRMLLALLNLRLGIWLPNPENEKVFSQVHDHRRLRVRPTPWYLVKEALGSNPIRGRFIYVSDGGHYENLGLVELLRRDCRTIWCIDAAGDKPGRTGTLTEAMLLAESELGVQWTDTKELENLHLDDKATKRREHLATVKGTYARLGYKLRNGDKGTVTVVKAGITESAPDHLIDYQQRHPSFPYDSTGNQLFRADRFDAYCSLGFASTKAAQQLTVEAG